MFPNSQPSELEPLPGDYIYDYQATPSQKWQQMAFSNPLSSQDQLRICDYLGVSSQLESEFHYALLAQQENQENLNNWQEQKPTVESLLGTQASGSRSDYARRPGVSSQPALLPKHFPTNPGQVFIVNTGGGSCPILLTNVLRVVNSDGQSVLVPSVSYLKQANQAVPKEPQQPVLRNSAARIQKTPEQLRVLESHFGTCDYPDSKMRRQIAAETGLTDNQVRLWFQYKRNKRNRATQEE